MSKRFIIFILLLSSCAYYPYREIKPTEGMIVDLASPDERVLPKIVDSHDSQEYGPTGANRVTSHSQADKKNINAFVFGPGGYRCLSYIAALREVEEERNLSLRPSVLLGHGLCSVVAAYYSFGYKPEYIEWKFFGFLRKVKDVKIFSNEWLDLYKRELINDLVDRKIEDSKITLIVPVLIGGSRVKYLSRGSLKDALLANVNIYEESKLKPLYMKSFLKRKRLQKIGVSRIITFDVLSDGISFEKGNGHIRGVYEKAVSQFLKDRNQFDIIISIPLKKYKIDDPRMVSNLIYDSNKFMKMTMSQLIKD